MAGPTSAPFNTFTLYRSRVYRDENTTYIAYRPLDSDFKVGLKRYTASFNLFECHGSITKLVAGVISWLVKHRTEKKKVIHAHQPGVGLVTFLIAYLLIGFKAPLVYTIHNNRSNFKGLKKFAIYACFKLSDQITFVSEDAFLSFKSSLSMRILEKACVIKNGADIDRIRLSLSEAHDNIINEKVTISCIGRLSAQKNLMFLLNVMSHLDCDFTLNIFGEGPERTSMREQIDHLGLSDKVFLRGNLPKNELFREIRASDIYVSVAEYEGLPMGLLEALALDVPSIVSNIQPHQEIKTYIPSLVIVDNIIDQWVDILTNKIQLAEREKGFKRPKISSSQVEKYFSMSRMQTEYSQVYEKLQNSMEA